MCKNLPCRGLPLSESCRSFGLSSLWTGIWRDFCSVGSGVTKLKESTKASKWKIMIPREWKAAVEGNCCARAQEMTELEAWAAPGAWQRRRRRQCRLRQKDRISDDCRDFSELSLVPDFEEFLALSPAGLAPAKASCSTLGCSFLASFFPTGGRIADGEFHDVEIVACKNSTLPLSTFCCVSQP